MLAKPPAPVKVRAQLPKARLTRAALFWILLYLGLPVLGLGVLLDVLVQWLTGRCTGVWCWF